jgi:hypothetical protein
MGWSSIELWIRHLAAHSQIIAIILGLSVSVAYLSYNPRDVDLSTRAVPGLFVGFAAGHVPASLLIIIASLDPAYLSYLREQRIQLALGGLVLMAIVTDRIVKFFKGEPELKMSVQEQKMHS